MLSSTRWPVSKLIARCLSPVAYYRQRIDAFYPERMRQQTRSKPKDEDAD